jgi:thiamine biosynthesis lipoprotein
VSGYANDSQEDKQERWVPGRLMRSLLSGGAATFALAASAASAEGFRHHQDFVLGTSFDFIASTPNAEEGQRALDAALAEIARLDPILSQWRGDSELTALNASTVFNASPDLFSVMARAERARVATRGNFSPRLGAMRALWRDAASRGTPPPVAELALLASEAAHARVALNAETRTIDRPEPVRFDLDASAKGYVIDQALSAAREAAPDIPGFMIDVGGDVATWGEAPAGDAWRIGVATTGAADNDAPMAAVTLSGHAIAVSGAGARDLQIGGETYPHLLSAHEGLASRQNRNAAVIAPTAEQADTLATALAVMPAADGLRLIRATPGSAAHIVDAAGQAWRSDNWATFATQTCQAANPALWPPSYAVSVSYELPRVSGTTRPYVAMWISDPNGNVVRTLLVLGDQARWREQNYIFWRRFERANGASVQAIARPTRAPGRYEVVWDGLDNAGRPAGRGQYNLNIEVNREHGSHIFQAIPLNLSDASAQAQTEARSEIGAVTVRYGRGAS